MALGALSASGTYVSMGGTTLSMSEWSLRVNPNLVDATSFNDLAVYNPLITPVVAGAYQNSNWGTFSDSIPTVLDAEIEVKGIWNWNEKPHVAPYQLYAGRTMSNLVLGILNPQTGTTVGGVTYSFAVYIVNEVRVMAALRDGLKLEFSAKNRGAFTYAQS